MTPTNPNLGFLLLLSALALAGCEPADESVTATASSSGDEPADGSATSSTGDEPADGSEAATSSSGDEPENLCELDDEDIPTEPFALVASFDDLDSLLEDVPCMVTAAGFDCAGVTYDVDRLFVPFGPLPWTEGEMVRLSTGFFWFTVSEVSVRSESGDLLAVIGARPEGTVGPITVTTEPSGCEDPARSSVVLLQATYTADGESITLAGARSGSVGGFEIYQVRADDISEISSGEIRETITFAATASPAS